MAFSGTAAVRAMKDGDYQATIYAGTAAGIQQAYDDLGGASGEIVIGPGVVDFGTSSLLLDGSSGAYSVRIRGSGERATQFTYSGTGDFIVIGADDGNHSGAVAGYNGTGPQIKMSDIRITGPGTGGSDRGIVDWECGSIVIERVTIDSWATGFFGIGSDVNSWRSCYFSTCDIGCFLGSRSDQNTFDSCYFALCGIGLNVEYAYNFRCFGCQFVFSTTADVVVDVPSSVTEGGDSRTDTNGILVGCWFESNSTPQLARHVWCGRNGTSSRRAASVVIQGGYVNVSNTLNFVDVEACDVVRVRDVYQAGTISGDLVNVVSVSGLAQEVTVENCRVNGGDFLAGTTGATQSLFYRPRQVNSQAYAASFTPNAVGGELIVIGALTGDITINAPTTPTYGRILNFKFQQDGTGGRTVTWNSVFKHTWSDSGNSPSTVAGARFFYDGTNWQQIGGQHKWSDSAGRITPSLVRSSDIASAATITPLPGCYTQVTGTTTIDNITAKSSDNGRLLLLHTTGALTISHNAGGTGNIRTAASTDLTMAANSRVQFVGDGTLWWQVAPQVNV